MVPFERFLLFFFDDLKATALFTKELGLRAITHTQEGRMP